MKGTNVNENEATSVAQKKQIAVYLLAGNSITQMDASEDVRLLPSRQPNQRPAERGLRHSHGESVDEQRQEGGELQDERRQPMISTVVYDKDGKEIDRIDGNVYVSGSKYPEEALPLRVQVVEVEVVNEYRIEK